MTVEMRLATAANVPLIARWRQEAAAWLAAKGSDQWSDVGLSMPKFVERVEASIAARETWVADVDGHPAATIAIDGHADPGLWTPSEQQESVIVHRMITDPVERRHGLGAVLLAHADAVARERGKGWVRLDAWTTNTALHDYYRRAGFRFVRIADPSRPSTALFERPVPDADPSATSSFMDMSSTN